MASAPLLLDLLADDDHEHFEAVKALLDAAGVAYEVDPTLVRGLDYYTRTVFEFTSDALGAQSRRRRRRALRRADGADRRRRATPGMGWAAGVERMLLASPRAAGRAAARRPLRRLRQARAPRGRVPPGRRRPPRRPRGKTRTRRALAEGPAQAGRPTGARYVAILGDEGTSLKDMEIGRAEDGGARHGDAPHPGRPVRPPRAEPLPRRLGRRARRAAGGRARPRRGLGRTAGATSAG